VTALSDIRILAVEQFAAGPFGSLHLADLGADVIKVEDARLGGDVGRYVAPGQDGDDSLYFQGFNRNKRSIALDMTSSTGKAVFRGLASRSDAVYSNVRGDVADKLGLRYAQLEEVNPQIVCCTLTGYGATSSRRAEPAYDHVLQGLAGWMSLTGEPEAPPTRTGLSLVDYCGGMVAALSVLAGIHAARRDGRGGDCDVSLFDTAMALLTYPATWWLSSGIRTPRTRQSAHPSLAPVGAFRTADGWIVLACAKEKFWNRLVDALGDRALEDPRFSSFESRHVHRQELTEALERALGRRSTSDWVATLSAAGVPCGPVNTVPEALADPGIADRDLLVELDHPRFGAVRQLATPARTWRQRSPARVAPGLGEHRDEALRELLGLDAEQIAALEDAGAFGRG
jgi:crotonobetainyl-CoA:carnitine CoA-transferase CaiB-like acyl-CoA transferase